MSQYTSSVRIGLTTGTDNSPNVGGYTPGSYRSPTGVSGTTSYTNSSSSQSQNKTNIGTSYQSPTSLATKTQVTATTSDTTATKSYSQTGGSYTPSSTSYKPSTGYTPSGGYVPSSYTPTNSTNNKTGTSANGGYSSPSSFTNSTTGYQPGSYTPTYANTTKPGYSTQTGGINSPTTATTTATGGYTSPTSITTNKNTDQPQSGSYINSNKPTTSYLTNTYTITKPTPTSYYQPGQDNKAQLGKDIFRQHLNKSASVSDYESLMTRLKATGEIFRDTEFPAELRSITGGNTRFAAKYASAVWRSPSEFWGSDAAVFKGGIDPTDIKQGVLGDCYFLSTLSALAEIPERILKLFKTKEINPYGCYAVQICEMGEWKEIVVDDLFPCKNRNALPMFTRGNDHELWVFILEKAWAKNYGSYFKIEAGLTNECLHDLTGAPTETLLPHVDDAEEIWKAIDNGEKKNYAMTCGSGDLADGQDLLTSCGLVGSHAYSLLSCVTLNTARGPQRLLKLRNPWGEAEWKGDWSDHSDLWTEDLKKQVGLEDKDDGIFYMSYEDFSTYFTDVQICRVHDDYEYSSFRFPADPSHPTYIRFTIAKEGHYYITLNQKSKRHFEKGYEYSDMYLIVGKELPGGEFEYVQGIKDANREVWTDGMLSPGSYLAYVKVPWNDEQIHDVTISIYGYSKTKFETVPKEAVGTFLEKVYMNKAMNSPALKSYEAEGEPNAFRVAETTDDGFGYFFFWNKSQATLESEVFFKIMSGIKLKKPRVGKKFKVTVAPGEKEIVLTKVNPYIEPKQIFQEVVTFKRSSEQLRVLAKEKGKKLQRKHHKTGELLDVWCYVLQHSDGFYFYYENNTKDLTLDEEVKFRLSGLKIESDPLNTSAKVVVPPGQTREIKITKILNEYSLGFSTAYLFKTA